MDPNVIPVVAIVGGLLVVLIPVAGITARFAFKPIVESIAKLKAIQATAPGGADVQQLEQRVGKIEQQLEGIDVSLQRLIEAKDFDRQLSSGRP